MPWEPPIPTHLGIIFALWDFGINLDTAGVGRGLLGILYESLQGRIALSEFRSGRASEVPSRTSQGGILAGWQNQTMTL